MFSKVISEAIYGVDGFLVQVEADVSDGLPMFDMVGYLASEVREAKERVRIALKNSNFFLPPKRITINLSPADVKKEGSAFDLPIAIAILTSLGYISYPNIQQIVIIGELSLNGEINSIHGVLPMIHHAFCQGITTCIVPKENSEEAALIQGMTVIGVSNLRELVDFLNYKIRIVPTIISKEKLHAEKKQNRVDFCDIIGQDFLKRAIEVAVAGRHNILLIGSPGAGKSMIAKRVPTIMPELEFSESIEVTKIYSINGMLEDNKNLITTRPFRTPHHTISPYAMTGGGRIPKPGEISLAHKGVLFLDELAEFSKNVLEVLRQPLEDREITISRVNASYRFPADFVLIAAMNPCPCGYYPDYRRCTCAASQIKRYLGKISKPLLDRIDINIEAKALPYYELECEKKGETSKEIRERVVKAQKVQKERYKNTNILFNSQLSNQEIEQYCKLKDKEKNLLKQAFTRMELSARAYYRILKVARTIADLDGKSEIETIHLSEAISYRSLDKKYWG